MNPHRINMSPLYSSFEQKLRQTIQRSEWMTERTYFRLGPEFRNEPHVSVLSSRIKSLKLVKPGNTFLEFPPKELVTHQRIVIPQRFACSATAQIFRTPHPSYLTNLKRRGKSSDNQSRCGIVWWLFPHCVLQRTFRLQVAQWPGLCGQNPNETAKSLRTLKLPHWRQEPEQLFRKVRFVNLDGIS